MSRAFRVAGAFLALAFLAFGPACKEEQKLKVTGWEPKVGPYSGSGTVTITGTGFQAGGARGVSVYFGNRPAKVLGWIGNNQLRVEAPPGEIGETVDIMMVFDDARTHKIEKAYTYEDIQKDFNVDALTEGAKATEGGSAPAPTATDP